MIWLGQAAEAPILEQIQSVIHSHPHVAGAVYQHGGDLTTRQTISGMNEGDGPILLNAIEGAGTCDPDATVSAG